MLLLFLFVSRLEVLDARTFTYFQIFQLLIISIFENSTIFNFFIDSLILLRSSGIFSTVSLVKTELKYEMLMNNT